MLAALTNIRELRLTFWQPTELILIGCGNLLPKFVISAHETDSLPASAKLNEEKTSPVFDTECWLTENNTVSHHDINVIVRVTFIKVLKFSCGFDFTPILYSACSHTCSFILADYSDFCSGWSWTKLSQSPNSWTNNPTRIAQTRFNQEKWTVCVWPWIYSVRLTCRRLLSHTKNKNTDVIHMSTILIKNCS